MVKLRSSTFILGVVAATGKAEPMREVGAKTVQVYAPGGVWWSKRPVIIRNAPYTIESPHEGQVDVRVKFGEIAKAAKGSKGFEEGLPVVAARIRRELKGYKSEASMAPEAYPSRVKRTYHTLKELEELREMLRERRMRAGVAWATRPY